MTWENAPDWVKEPVPLTPRQVEIVSCWAEGMNSTETAKKLGVSTSTVKNHTTMIFDRLGLERRCRLAAIIQAWRRGEVVIFNFKGGNDEEQD